MLTRKDKGNKYEKTVSFVNAKSPLRTRNNPVDSVASKNKELNSPKKDLPSPRSPHKRQSTEADAVSLLLDRGYKLRKNLMKFTNDNDDSGSNGILYSSKPENYVRHINKSNLDEVVVDFLLDPEDNHEELLHNSDDSYIPTDDDTLSDVDDPLHDDSILKSLFYSDEIPQQQSVIEEMKPKSRSGPIAPAQHNLTQEQIAYFKKVRFIRVFVDNLRLFPNVRLPIEDTFNKRKYYLMYEFLKPSIGGRQHSVSMSTDAVKVPAKTIISNELHFGHRSVFPWNMGNVSQCKGLMLIFTLHHKLNRNPKLDLIGSGRLELDHIISQITMNEQNLVNIRSKKSVSKVVGISNYDGQRAKDKHVSDEYDFGQLKLKVDLVLSGTNAKAMKVATSSDVPFTEKQQHFEIADLGVKAFDENAEAASRKYALTKELFPDNSQEHPTMQTMHCLLSVSEGKFAFPSVQTMDAKNLVLADNLYLKCRLFWSKETVQSEVSWNTPNPVFTLVCVTPVNLSSDLLRRTQNNFMVIEILKKSTNPVQDALIGICKLPLHLFYLYFCDKNILKSLLQSQHAVVAVDDWIPALNVFSGEVVGSLKVLLAMGTPQQITSLKSHNFKTVKIHTERNEKHYNIEIGIKGCQTLLLPLNSVWGECDCYIQYFFLTTRTSTPGQLSLELHRTLPKLCKPDVGIHYVKTHTLTASSFGELRHNLLKAFSRTGMSFQLWYKYYFPGEQDFLFAEAHLPIGRIIEVIEGNSAIGEEFYLTLTYADTSLHSEENLSKLHISIKYKETPHANATNSNVQAENNIFLEKVANYAQTDVEIATVNQVAQTSLPWDEIIIPEKISQADNIPTEIELLDDTENSFIALLSVERGSGLSFVNSKKDEAEPPSTFVVFQRYTSHDVKSNIVLRSCSPEWNFRIETQLLYHSLIDKKGLVFKVCYVTEDSYEDCDQTLGFCTVDITPLASGMSQIHGWYNLMNLQGECKGQILVLIRPLQELDLNSVHPTDDSTSSSVNEGKFTSYSNYTAFPSHISRFPEQRIRINYVGSLDDSTHAARDLTQDSSKSFLVECLKKNLGELDLMQKYLHDNLGDHGRIAFCPNTLESPRINNLSATRSNCCVAEECLSDDSAMDNNTVSNANQRRHGDKSRIAAAIFNH